MWFPNPFSWFSNQPVQQRNNENPHPKDKDTSIKTITIISTSTAPPRKRRLGQNSFHVPKPKVISQANLPCKTPYPSPFLPKHSRKPSSESSVPKKVAENRTVEKPTPRRSLRASKPKQAFNGVVLLPWQKRSRKVDPGNLSYRDRPVENESPAPSPLLAKPKKRLAPGAPEATFKPPRQDSPTSPHMSPKKRRKTNKSAKTNSGDRGLNAKKTGLGLSFSDWDNECANGPFQITGQPKSGTGYYARTSSRELSGNEIQAASQTPAAYSTWRPWFQSNYNSPKPVARRRLRKLGNSKRTYCAPTLFSAFAEPGGTEDNQHVDFELPNMYENVSRKLPSPSPSPEPDLSRKNRLAAKKSKQYS